MGEYGLYGGQRIKLGTCEDMYYLRADQARHIVSELGNVNVRSAEDQKTIRFRFPWPDEDRIEPGAFQDHEKSVGVPGDISAPNDLEHYSVQFSARVGYLVSLPCPESPAGRATGLPIHRNGFAGAVKVVQQAYRSGNLAVICQCGGCGARYNLPTWEDAEPVVVAFRSAADRMAQSGNDGRIGYYHAIADRIAEGYRKAPAEVTP